MRAQTTNSDIAFDPSCVKLSTATRAGQAQMASMFSRYTAIDAAREYAAPTWAGLLFRRKRVVFSNGM